MRDIFKQWYLNGINSRVSTPELLIKFLKDETRSMKIITIGSSAGGYASLLYGSLLNARRIIAINPQVEINSLIARSSFDRNPILFRNLHSELSKYYDIRNIVDINKDNVYYLYSTKSGWDKEQFATVHNFINIHFFPFYTSHHGIPFLKVALKKFINLNEVDLAKFENKLNNPFLFTISLVGIYRTIIGLYSQWSNK